MYLCPDCQGAAERFLQDCYAVHSAEGITFLGSRLSNDRKEGTVLPS